MPLRPFASPLCTRRYAVAWKQATVVEFILRTFRHSPWFCTDSYSCKADGKQFYGILCICGDSSSQRNPIIPPLTLKKEDSTLTIRRSDLLLNQLGISRFCPTPGIISSSMWKSVWSGFRQNRCGHSSAIERDIQANCWKVWKYAVFELCCILHLYLLSRSSLLWFVAVFSSWDFILWFCLNELTWYWAICAMRDRIVLEYNKFCQPSILAIRQLTVELTVSRDYCTCISLVRKTTESSSIKSKHGFYGSRYNPWLYYGGRGFYIPIKLSPDWASITGERASISGEGAFNSASTA